MIGTATDPLSAPSHVTLEQKQADEIVALAAYKALGQTFTSGLWHSQDFGNVGTQTPATGNLILYRWDFPPGATVVQLGEWVVTPATAGGLRRLCIYNDDGAGYPGSLLQDGGTYDATGSNFQSVTSFSAVDVSGTKWIGGVATVAAAGVAGFSQQGRSMALATVVSGNNPWCGYIQTGVTGALPDPFTTTRVTTNGMTRVFVKVG
jgi:hypothetical protein